MLRVWHAQGAVLPKPAPPPPTPLLLKVVTWFMATSTKCDLDDDDFSLLRQLSLDTFDSDDFYMLPVLVLFARKGGADPAWTRHCVSDKMLVGTTPDGWMTEAWKLRWYKHVRLLRNNPMANINRTILDQKDGHYSNLTVELSLEIEKDGNIGVITRGHHTGALQVPDVRGGPNFHANRINKELMRREQRCGNICDEATILRIIEISVAVSHNPNIWAAGVKKVGWLEDEEGHLTYNPMATVDMSLVTQTKPAWLVATAISTSAVKSEWAEFRFGQSKYAGADALLGEAAPGAQLAAETVQGRSSRQLSPSMAAVMVTTRMMTILSWMNWRPLHRLSLDLFVAPRSEGGVASSWASS